MSFELFLNKYNNKNKNKLMMMMTTKVDLESFLFIGVGEDVDSTLHPVPHTPQGPPLGRDLFLLLSPEVLVVHDVIVVVIVVVVVVGVVLVVCVVVRRTSVHVEPAWFDGSLWF